MWRVFALCLGSLALHMSGMKPLCAGIYALRSRRELRETRPTENPKKGEGMRWRDANLICMGGGIIDRLPRRTACVSQLQLKGFFASLRMTTEILRSLRHYNPNESNVVADDAIAVYSQSMRRIWKPALRILPSRERKCAGETPA